MNTPKKILILGNSNSILKDGWLTFFKEKSNIECLNLSIGGSPSPALILQVLLNENKLDNIELAIIEPCVIDHGEEWQDPIAIKKYALLLFSLLASKDIKSFLLVLPRNFKALTSDTKGMRSWMDIADNFGIGYLNCSSLIRNFSKENDLTLEQCWRDDHGHLIAACQSIIGHEVANSILHINSDTLISPPRLEDFFKLFLLKDLVKKNITTIERSSTLMSVSCAKLKVGSEFYLDSESNLSLYGFLINYGEMSSANKAILHLVTEHSHIEVNVQNQFCSVEPTRKLTVLYKSIRPVNKVNIVNIPDVLDNSVYTDDSNHSIEVIGVLVGRDLGEINI